jgi:hypothetical protein
MTRARNTPEESRKAGKQYPLPSDLMAIWWVAKGAAALRDRYVVLRFFGYKGALKASADNEMMMARFWGHIRKLYPELKGKTLQLDEPGAYVTVVKP